MNTLVPTYSDGSFLMRPLVRELSFLTFGLAPNVVSAFHSRSPSHHEPASVTTNFKLGCRSNAPDSSNCHNGRCVQNGTSMTNCARFSLYAGQSPSPECVCTTRPA